MNDEDAGGFAGDESRPDEMAVTTVDLGGAGGQAVLLQNGLVCVLVSPGNGGRLLHLAEVGSAPPSVLAPAALVDVGHEEDRWEVIVARPNTEGVEAVLGHVRGGCPLLGSLKIYRLERGAHHVEVDYRLAPLDAPFTVGSFLPPDVWVHVPEGEPLAWEATATSRSLRATSPEGRFTVHVGIGDPPSRAVTIDLRGEVLPEAPAEGGSPDDSAPAPGRSAATP